MDLSNQYSSLKGYFNDSGKLTAYPGKRQKKRQSLILQYLAEKFESHRIYNEKEVNEILNQYHIFEDPASLRRFLIGQGFLTRTNDGRIYQKP